MRLAWFRAGTPRAASVIDDTAALIEELRSRHDVELFTSDTAPGFAGRHMQIPFDMAVYELDRTPAHAWMWPFLLRHRGALMLRTTSTADLGRAVRASRVTVVPHPTIAEDLRRQYPESQIRVAATGVPEIHPGQNADVVQPSPVVFGALPASRIGLLRRVLDGAGLALGGALLMTDPSAERVLGEADVIVSLGWPWSGEPAAEALAAMAAGKPVIVLETAGTAEWPALDPQSWRPRGPTRDAPVVVSIDPLDEEHSLVLAVTRLAADATLRQQLGAAGHGWWRAHATPGHAAADWERILADASRAATT